jgi:prevent-host-death family protein
LPKPAPERLKDIWKVKIPERYLSVMEDTSTKRTKASAGFPIFCKKYKILQYSFFCHARVGGHPEFFNNAGFLFQKLCRNVGLTGRLTGAIIKPVNSIQEDYVSSNIKYSEDIVPISDLKINPGRIISQVDKTRRPVLLTSRGRGVAVVESVKDYEEKAEEQEFLRGVVQGLMDIEEGREISLADVKKRLGLT